MDDSIINAEESQNDSLDNACAEAEDSAQAVKEKPKAKKKKSAKYYAVKLIIKVCVTVFVLTILLVFVVGIHVNHSNSSFPMIKDGDLCITYKLSTPQKGDVIAYKHNGELRFSRIIAVGGDSVDIKNDYVTVNGSGILDDTVYKTSSEGAKISFPYTVPNDTVFVLNDFRSDNSDSRSFGGIPLKDCEGKVVFVMRRRGI